MQNLKSGTNEHVYETETHSQTQGTDGCQGRDREGRTGSLGLADANYCVWDGKTRSRYTAQGTKLNIP